MHFFVQSLNPGVLFHEFLLPHAHVLGKVGITLLIISFHLNSPDYLAYMETQFTIQIIFSKERSLKKFHLILEPQQTWTNLPETF